MLKPERMRIILDYMQKNQSATIKQIAKDIGFSESTVRRELTELEKQFLVRRSYGFAELLKSPDVILPFSLRTQDNRREKTEAAKKAVGLIQTGDTVFLDESSTTSILAELILPNTDITVITTSLITADILVSKNIKTFCTGGEIIARTMSFAGKFAENLITSVFADKLFFSSSGITEDGVICDKMQQNAAVNSVMIAQSRQKIYLCDHTKYNKSYPYIISRPQDIDIFVSDTVPPKNYIKVFKNCI